MFRCLSRNLFNKESRHTEWKCQITSKEKIKELKIVFKGLGTLPGKPYHISIDDSVKLIMCSSRRVPLSIITKLDCVLNKF